MILLNRMMYLRDAPIARTFHKSLIEFQLKFQRTLEKRSRVDFASFCVVALLKTFQNRSVSSPAPVTIDSPSGDIA